MNAHAMEAETARNDREHLRQKYANAKNNFTVVVVRLAPLH
jgi:uncharacterized protein (DUF3084 family)